MIIREERVEADVLKAIYKTIEEVIKDKDCYYTTTELKELHKQKYIKVGGTLKNG